MPLSTMLLALVVIIPTAIILTNLHMLALGLVKSMWLNKEYLAALSLLSCLFLVDLLILAGVLSTYHP